MCIRDSPKSEIFPRLKPSRSVARRVLRILALTGAGATAVCVLINQMCIRDRAVGESFIELAETEEGQAIFLSLIHI